MENQQTQPTQSPEPMKNEFSLKREPVEERIARLSKTGLMRETVLTLHKVWQSLELLAFIGAASMLLWGGTKISNIHGYTDFLEAIVIGIAALLFARIGWSMPESRFKKAVEKYTQVGK